MTKRVLILVLAALACQVALAFRWTPLEFPEGDQAYTLELRTAGDSGEAQLAQIRIEITDTGGSYSVATTYTMNQENVAASDLGNAAFGTGMMGMFAFGPMLMFGPSFMMLPMMLGDEEIEVRSEPMRIMGMGRLSMSETVEVAGRECVVLRFEPDDGEPVEIAVAENVPFPCYTRFDSGDGGVTEIRLIDVR